MSQHYQQNLCLHLGWHQLEFVFCSQSNVPTLISSHGISWVCTGDLHLYTYTCVAMTMEVLLHKHSNRRLKSVYIFSYIQTHMFTSTSKCQWHGYFKNEVSLNTNTFLNLGCFNFKLSIIFGGDATITSVLRCKKIWLRSNEAALLLAADSWNDKKTLRFGQKWKESHYPVFPKLHFKGWQPKVSELLYLDSDI